MTRKPAESPRANTKFKPPSGQPKSANDLDAEARRVYEKLLRAADPDEVHNLILRDGAGSLRQDLPYLIIAARWLEKSSWRRDARRRNLLEKHGAAAEPVAPLEGRDPFVAYVANQEASALLSALGKQDEVDALIMIRHSEGYSDSETLADLERLYPDRPPLTPATLRKRRQRVRERIRAELANAGHRLTD